MSRYTTSHSNPKGNAHALKEECLWRWEWTSLSAVAGSLEWMDFFFQSTSLKKQTLNKVVDRLNDHFGKNALFYGAMGTQNSWLARFDKSSRVNLSKIKSLPIVLAK
ncbi:MAG: DUF4113 domain-containing protein [Parachlamydiaceae bacterium]